MATYQSPLAPDPALHGGYLADLPLTDALPSESNFVLHFTQIDAGFARTAERTEESHG